MSFKWNKILSRKKKETILSLKQLFHSTITNNTTISTMSLQKEKVPDIEEKLLYHVHC